MKSQNWAQTHIIVFVSLLFASCPCLLCEAFGEESNSLETHSAMLTFSKTIKSLDKALAGDDAQKIIHLATVLKEASQRATSDLEPQKNGEMFQVFNEHLTRIGSLSSEMVSLAGKRDFTEESQVVEEIRHSCISCHVKFRDNKGREHDLFPNVGNVITGEVGILKLNGEERNDRTNVLVFLDRVKTKSDFLLPRKNPVISQKNRIYSPKVLPVVVGTTVDFPNDDTIFHNVFSLSKTMPFDLDIYRPGNSKSVTFTKTGWVKLYCNIHPKMTANILILDNPFFDLTDQRGIFVIPDVPDGEYTLRVWYETGDEVRKTIKISDALLYEFDFEVHESKRIVEHKTKFGKPYKNKYE